MRDFWVQVRKKLESLKNPCAAQMNHDSMYSMSTLSIYDVL